MKPVEGQQDEGNSSQETKRTGRHIRSCTHRNRFGCCTGEDNGSY
ncbi:hypothetical protein T12_6557 [Trichinella patagoniensis]|uniref:Uncharacterized protein n=1 Tax=Trichinella patagoniensis TaxID=990121 RepID=A0A0V0W6K7_9BILA|nr:hypothetical protein T12_6557 [Trichinella patagoniensis]